MLIPSIDLMDGKIVQLVQGERKALEFTNAAEWIARFSRYPMVQVIDLDAAMGKGSNRELITGFCHQLPCQVGGGIRTADSAAEVIESGAKRVIIGSSLLHDSQVNLQFAKGLSDRVGADHVVCAIDSRAGHVAIHGWKTITSITPSAMMQALEPYCAAFLYTHIDTEGLLQGIPLDPVLELRRQTSRQFIAAGGIRSREEIDALHELGIDAVVGMAIYSGLIEV